MLQERLKMLAHVQVNEEQKYQDMNAIKEKMVKQPSKNWRIPFVIVASMAIFWSLIVLSSTQDIKTSTQVFNPEMPVVAVYFSDIKTTKKPISEFYSATIKVEGEQLEKFNRLVQLSKWQYVDQSIPDNAYILTLKFEDEIKKVFYLFESEQYDYLYDEESKYAYVLSNETYSQTFTHTLLMWYIEESGNVEKLYFLALLLPLLQAWVSRIYKKKHGLHKAPKSYSSIWQMVTTLVIVFSLLIYMYVETFVHIGWWIAGIALNIIAFNLLEKKELEHSRYRRILHAMLNVTLVFIVVFILYRLI